MTIDLRERNFVVLHMSVLARGSPILACRTDLLVCTCPLHIIFIDSRLGRVVCRHLHTLHGLTFRYMITWTLFLKADGAG